MSSWAILQVSKEAERIAEGGQLLPIERHVSGLLKAFTGAVRRWHPHSSKTIDSATSDINASVCIQSPQGMLLFACPVSHIRVFQCCVGPHESYF